jgi:simple sugar transport system substrate-binding protein
MQAKQAAGSQAKIVTFDLNQDVVKAIQDKSIEFCIDQQPYLKGYLSDDALWIYKFNGNTIGGGQNVATGPAFIDEKNIAQVAEFAAKGTR